jgi:beta-N-acetylhexosaminidase
VVVAIAAFALLGALLGTVSSARAATPRTVASTSSTTSSTLPVCTIAAKLAGWSDVQLVNQMVVVPLHMGQVATAGLVAREGYGGVLLFGWTAPANLGSQLASLRAQVPRHVGLLVMTDDEGGQVWRAANLVAPLPWAKWMAAQSPGSITALAKASAAKMAAIGINVDLAPVLDIDARAVVPGRADADGLRSFSGSAAVVSADGVAFMRGLAQGGVVPVVKHFPGLGGVSPNTDYGAASTAPWATVQKTSLAPFKAAIAAGAPALMVSNATIPGLSAGPAVLSRTVVTGVIRGQLGFHGLIVTDSLSAGAISAFHLPVPAAAVTAVTSGADLVLFSVSGTTSPIGEANRVSQALVAAMGSGQLSRARIESSVARVLAARGVHLC